MGIYNKLGPICQAKSTHSTAAGRQERPDDPEDEPGVARRLPEGLEEEIPALEAAVDEVVEEP